MKTCALTIRSHSHSAFHRKHEAILDREQSNKPQACKRKNKFIELYCHVSVSDIKAWLNLRLLCISTYIYLSVTMSPTNLSLLFRSCLLILRSVADLWTQSEGVLHVTFAFCLAPLFSYGLMHVLTIIERDERQYILTYLFMPL